MKDVTWVLLKLVLFCENDDIMFRSRRGNALSRVASPSIITDYIRACYKEVTKEVVGSNGSGDV